MILLLLSIITYIDMTASQPRYEVFYNTATKQLTTYYYRLPTIDEKSEYFATIEVDKKVRKIMDARINDMIKQGRNYAPNGVSREYYGKALSIEIQKQKSLLEANEIEPIVENSTGTIKTPGGFALTDLLLIIAAIGWLFLLLTKLGLSPFLSIIISILIVCAIAIIYIKLKKGKPTNDV